jgi:hypothetical protein
MSSWRSRHFGAEGASRKEPPIVLTLRVNGQTYQADAAWQCAVQLNSPEGKRGAAEEATP